ncbi:hypothetical protein COCMIDRAFT_107458 [Bipolaris oryzae ATCC 44560]|uniref:Uncharacterized protein n=1 Tax=Bipolaris oryzae ATCC 44560 TaxID=930090 RepID=W6YNN2_COCMI|nr:uncharacterized protein COCMIDRAFT_107458 [Bipolaris oryzae ATCC 44560]EUC40972.1 hypothetical protein COCMIDRAFT_107458 [Bipolaris oryzae ATCC 44560]
MSVSIATQAFCLTNLTHSVSTLSHLFPLLNLSHLRAVCRNVLSINLNRRRIHAYVHAMIAVSCPLNIGVTGGCRKTHTHRARTLSYTISRICMPGDTPTNCQSPKMARRTFGRLDSCMSRFEMCFVVDNDEVLRRSLPMYHPWIA